MILTVIPGRAIQVGLSRLGHSKLPISGKPEIGGVSPESKWRQRTLLSPFGFQARRFAAPQNDGIFSPCA
jgi:hypothetical protein